MTSSWITTIKRTAATVFTAAAVLVSGCSSPETSDMTSLNSYKYEQELNIIDDNFRNYYQIFVGSFCDSNGDGIGDLNGITSKLDYIQDMGFNGIWLTPIMPSRSYHKYSVEDYYSIDPQFGTMEDFENLSAECEKRGISLLIDLVMNHSSLGSNRLRRAFVRSRAAHPRRKTAFLKRSARSTTSMLATIISRMKNLLGAPRGIKRELSGTRRCSPKTCRSCSSTTRTSGRNSSR